VAGLLEASSSVRTSLDIAVGSARGLALTQSGGFYVVDASSNLIVELDATGAVLRSLPAPGPMPARLAYVPAGPGIP